MILAFQTSLKSQNVDSRGDPSDYPLELPPEFKTQNILLTKTISFLYFVMCDCCTHCKVLYVLPAVKKVKKSGKRGDLPPVYHFRVVSDAGFIL